MIYIKILSYKLTLKTIFIGLVFFIYFIIIIFACFNKTENIKSRIIELKDYTYFSGEYPYKVFREEYFIIANPPKNLLKLKEVVSEYNKTHPVTPAVKNETSINRVFLRESKYTPKDWYPGKNRGGFDGSDDMEDHLPIDSIVSIWWETDNYTITHYWLDERKKNGEVIYDINLID